VVLGAPALPALCMLAGRVVALVAPLPAAALLGFAEAPALVEASL
jgi:hypothetical protein